MYNFHVVVVHFPIALLSLYAILEILRFRVIREWHPIFYVKGLLVILGTLAAWGAVITGYMLVGFGEQAGILDKHQDLGLVSAIFFTFLAAAYKVAWLGRVRNYWPRMADSAESFIRSSWAALLALIGLGLITLTGALGGAMAFGPDVDPWTPMMLRLLGL